MKKTLRALLDAVAEQRAKSSPEGDGDYCLHYGDLDRVEHFLLSFDEPGALRSRNKPSDTELAERLAKVEDRLAKHDERFDTQAELVLRRHGATNERIDKVAEIIGERVSGLVDQLMALAQKAGSVGAEHSEKLDQHSRDIGRLLHLIFDEKPAPAFPTGGASTAEAAAEAVLPVPQRGDRVRLEGAQSVGYTTIADGWYDVLGQQAGSFQVRFASDRGTPSDIVGLGLFWIDNNHPGLKEVKANASA